VKPWEETWIAIDDDVYARMADSDSVDIRATLRNAAPEGSEALIAAAPDLYRALEAVLANTRDNNSDSSWWERRTAAHALAEAALRKARGE